MTKISPNDTCPCTSGKKYKKCCRRYHNGMTIPEPEYLMRARYSAYALGLADFIMETTHPDNKDADDNPVRWRTHIEAYSRRNVFQNLEVLSAEGDTVTYRAEILAFHQTPTIITEESVFAKYDGAWKYLSGKVNVEESEIKDA